MSKEKCVGKFLASAAVHMKQCLQKSPTVHPGLVRDPDLVVGDTFENRTAFFTCSSNLREIGNWVLYIKTGIPVFKVF